MCDSESLTIYLNQEEMDILFSQPPSTEGEGGFQNLLVGLQRRTNRNTGELTLNREDRERIPRYAFDYGQGGWEDGLKRIFQRTLGPHLGR